jgi:hypothetical protein
MKPINCKHFYIPKLHSKVLINTGYCQKIIGKCILLKNRELSCSKREKRHNEA